MVLHFMYLTGAQRVWYMVVMAIFQAQFDASELITQREVVSEKVQELLMERGNSFGLILDDISIVSYHSNQLFVLIFVH